MPFFFIHSPTTSWKPICPSHGQVACIPNQHLSAMAIRGERSAQWVFLFQAIVRKSHFRMPETTTHHQVLISKKSYSTGIGSSAPVYMKAALLNPSNFPSQHTTNIHAKVFPVIRTHWKSKEKNKICSLSLNPKTMRRPEEIHTFLMCSMPYIQATFRRKVLPLYKQLDTWFHWLSHPTLKTTTLSKCLII